MSTPASQERPRLHGRTHTEDEWERVKQPFYHYYIEKNLSLKEATQRMSEDFNFDATPRQWERRVAPEKWNFTKYANREERLRAISASGKTLLEVSHRGRRRSTASDGRPSLTEDRNLRRFARREVSREPRPRASSVGMLSDASDEEMTGTSTAPSPSASEGYMGSQVNTPFPNITFEDSNEQWPSTVPSLQTENVVPSIDISDYSIPQINVSGPEDTIHISPDSIPIAHTSQVNVHMPHIYADEERFPAYGNSSAERFESNIGIDGSIDQSMDMSFNWQNQNPFASQPTKGPEPFQEFNFNDMPFTQMLAENDINVRNPHALTSAHLDAFNNENLQLQEPLPTPVTPEEHQMPEFDNTHADVHSLLQDHYRTTMDMIDLCLQSCQNATSKSELPKEMVMNRLSLLKRSMQAHSMYITVVL